MLSIWSQRALGIYIQYFCSTRCIGTALSWMDDVFLCRTSEHCSAFRPSCWLTNKVYNLKFIFCHYCRKSVAPASCRCCGWTIMAGCVVRSRKGVLEIRFACGLGRKRNPFPDSVVFIGAVDPAISAKCGAGLMKTKRSVPG